MIGMLNGILVEKQPPLLLLEVQGVGYEVLAPMTVFYQLPATGEAARLYTHLVVREDAHTLYGFLDRESREAFRELIRVNGVGPKMALAILSTLEMDDLAHSIATNDLNRLVKVPGIGRKTAERLLVELRDRLALPLAHGDGRTDSPAPSATHVPDRAGAIHDAESALVALGYKPADAEKAVAQVGREHPAANREQLIRLALRSMLSR